MPEGITRLSELEVGKTYKMEADDVACTIMVLFAGPSPTCIVYGSLCDVEQSITTPIVMQLVGWMAFPADNDDIVPIKEAFMHFDERPPLASLVGAWHAPHKEHIVQVVAVMPTITEL